MKTTIEIEGVLITISHSEENVSVVATKDDEVMEEFTLSLSEEESEGSDEEAIKDFGEFGAQEQEDLGEESDDDDDDDDDKSDDEDIKLESFQSFINKKKK